LLENTTRQTLADGTIAFYAGGAFVGESFLPRSKPGERHFLEHGTDLDVELKSKKSESKEAFKKITYKNRGFKEHFLRTRKIALTVQNRDSEPRRIYLRLRVLKNAKIEGADALDFDLKTGRPYAIFNAPKNSKSKRTLTLVEGLSRYFYAPSMRAETLKKLAGKGLAGKGLTGKGPLPAAQRAALLELVAKRVAIDKHQAKIERNKHKRLQIKRQLERLRKHLKALGAKTANAAAPLVKRILAAEDDLTAKQKATEPLQREKKTLHRAFAAALEGLEKIFP